MSIFYVALEFFDVAYNIYLHLLFTHDIICFVLVSCILASPFYYHYGLRTDIHNQCVLLTDDNLQRQFRIYTVTLYYFIPLIIILICYTRLLYYVYSKEKKLIPKNVNICYPEYKYNLSVFSVRNPMQFNGLKSVVR